MRIQLRRLALALALSGSAVAAQAALFSDDEARTAILELRQRVETMRQAQEAAERRRGEETEQLRRSLLDLQNQIEALRAEQARLRGQNEELTRALAEMQRAQASLSQSINDRLRAFEPQKVSVDGREFTASPQEKKEFDVALSQFRGGDFAGSQAAFVAFAQRYPDSGYMPSVLFWLGNAQYATRNYKEAVANLRAMLTRAPDHPRAPDALLSIANSQVELKDTRAARSTLEEVVQRYPQSEAAIAAKERLARLR
ncbi:MAG: tol-pal system protein YbgF [Pseudomonadota bacterium]